MVEFMTQMQIRDRIVFFSVLAMTFACSYPAFAQVATTGVDLAPTANSLITAFASALTVAATTLSFFGIRFLSAKIGMANTQQELLIQEQVAIGITKAIQFAEAWAKEQVVSRGNGMTRLSFDNMFLDVAAGYFARSFPDLIAKKRSMLSDARIKEMITAAVSPYLKTPVVDSGVLQMVTSGDVIERVPDAAR